MRSGKDETKSKSLARFRCRQFGSTLSQQARDANLRQPCSRATSLKGTSLRRTWHGVAATSHSPNARYGTAVGREHRDVYRVGVDIGGTFTDVVVASDEGEIIRARR